MNLQFQRIFVLGLIALTSILNMALGIPMKGNASVKSLDVLRNNPSRTGSPFFAFTCSHDAKTARGSIVLILKCLFLGR
jgi:hypothetical protein